MQGAAKSQFARKRLNCLGCGAIHYLTSRPGFLAPRYVPAKAKPAAQSATTNTEKF